MDFLHSLPRLLEGSVLQFELALSVESPLGRVANSRVHVAVERRGKKGISAKERGSDAWWRGRERREGETNVREGDGEI